jgi:hypothetical protein
MIMLDDAQPQTKSHLDKADLSSALAQPQAGPSEPTEPPPSFEQSTADPVFDFDDNDFSIPGGGEEPPPDFTPYNAEYSVAWNGNIISHDPHLNRDGLSLPSPSTPQLSY